MADTAAVILSAIEKVDSWLLQKADHQNDYAKLCSLRLEKKNLVVGMMEVWENDNEMLYSLLVGVADLWDVEEEKVDNDKLYSFLGEMKDLWELTCWEKLHSLLLEMMDPDIGDEKLFSLAVGMADLWKDSRGKLNKEKLYSWLAMKTHLWEQDKLFDLLEGVTILDGLNEEDWKNVEGVRNDLRFMLDYFLNKLEDEGSSHGHLHYFMSDVVEMAHHVQVLIHVKDSDPFILFLQIVNLYLRRSTTYVAHAINFSGGFLDFFFEIKPIQECLEETEKRVRKFGEIKNVREELVGPSPTYRESDHHLVGLKRKFGADETSQKNNVREELVGLKEDVEFLLRNAETTIRILGLAGIGKTTLAREFYNHREIVDGFECRAWVCLSSWKLSRRELLIKLIHQFIHSKRDDMLIEKMENKALRQMLHQHLQGKPYVLVLDDVSEVTYLRYVFFQALPRVFIFINSLPLSSSTTTTLLPNLTTDQHALLAFKHTLTSDPHGVLSKNWSAKAPVCSWIGVTCSFKHHRVIALNVSGFELGGIIAPHLGNLSFLRSLDVSFNNFVGSIPSELSSLCRLKQINISVNELTGEIPSWLGALSKLEYISLNNNSFSGEITPHLFNISSLIEINMRHNRLSGELPNDICNKTSKLKTMYLSGNLLSGKIPTDIYKCIELEDLRLPMNSFIGNIPSEIGRLTQLKVLSLFLNNFQGNIPVSLFNISSLTDMALFHNNLTGPLSSDICDNLPNMKGLYLFHNQLEGQIPSNIWKCRKLEVLVLSNNHFSGIIPSCIGNSSAMVELFLHNNKLSGEIPPSICNMKSLEALSLSNNSLDGSIPECLGNLSKSLQGLFLRENNFQGVIPPNFAGGCSLKEFITSGNKLEGALPPSMINCGNLRVLDVGNNRIQDKFPFWMESFPYLEVLILRSNMLYGTLVRTSGTKLPFPKLRVFDISRNAFTGSLPTSFLNNFRAMIDIKETKPKELIWSVSYEADKLTLTLKGLEQSLGRILTTFTTIDLSCNRFSGSIPNSIGNLNSLKYLNLSHNCLTGHIPASLGNVSALESLDLSSNQLEGNIPVQLTRLTFLSSLNFSMNNLSGQIPQSGGQFPTFDNSSYLGNLALCGFPLMQKCGDDNDRSSIPIPQHKRDGSDFLQGFCWQAVTLGYGCGFIFGVIKGYVILINGKPKWLVEFFFGPQHKMKRRHT